MKKIIVLIMFLLTAPLVSVMAVDSVKSEATGQIASEQPDLWLVHEGGHFVFIYRGRDRSFMEDLLKVSDDSYRVVCGYFGFEPNEKPRVIIYGDQDVPAFGGYCSPFPLRIALSAATAYSPRTLLTHEFTHWMNAVRPTGFMHVVGSIFGRDLSFLSLGLEFHFVEGITSLLDGSRSDTWNEMLYKAPLLEERMWTFEQTWSGGETQPGPLRTYLSGMLLADYLYRHFGPDAFARLEKRFANFPFLGDTEALRYVTGMDPRLVWSEALREARERFDGDAAIVGGKILTPQDSVIQNSWILIQNTARGLLLSRSSIKQSPQFGFYQMAEGPNGRAETWRPIRGILDNVIGATMDQAGTLMVVSRAPEALSGRDDERSQADLWVIHVQESSDGASYTTEYRQLTHHAQLTRPTLSADGTTLYAIQRVSNQWRLVRVDLETGAINIFIDHTKAAGVEADQEFSVVRVAVSPDGNSLGLLLSRQGDTDLAMVNANGTGLTWITHDAATEFGPRFGSDGRLQFASDRENAIVLYAYDPVKKTISRLLRDRIGVWAGVDSIAPDGSDTFIYQSYTAQGYVLKALPASALENTVMPNFGQLLPNWIARRDTMWKDLQNLAPKPGPDPLTTDAAQLEAVTPVSQPDKPFVDLALPFLWLPTFGFDASGFSLGAQVQAASILGSNQWALAGSWVPSAAQFNGSFTVGLAQPGFKLSAAAALEYSASASAAAFYQDRIVSLDLSFNLAADRFPDGTVVQLDGNLGSRADWWVSRNQSFDLTTAFTLSPTLDFLAYSGLGFSALTTSSTAAFFGAGGIDMGLKFYVRPLVQDWGIATKFNLGFQAALGTTILRMEGSGAWDGTGHAASLVKPFSKSWSVVDGPWRVNGTIYWAIPFELDVVPQGQLSIEKRGLIFGVGSGGALPRNSNFTWDGYLVASAEYRWWVLWTITPVPLVAGIAFRADPTNFSAANGNLVVYFGINGQGISISASDAHSLP